MARPIKVGMTYFPHDTDALTDEKIEAMRAVYGNDGYAFYFILLESIYTKEFAELDISSMAIRAVLAKRVGVTVEKFEEMLTLALSDEIGLFDRNRYVNDHVLTSKGIKRRAEEVEKMREKWRTKKKGSGVFPGENPTENNNNTTEFSPEKTQQKTGVFTGENTVEYDRVFPGENPTENATKKSKEKEKKSIVRQEEDEDDKSNVVRQDRKKDLVRQDAHTREEAKIVDKYLDAFKIKGCSTIEREKLQELCVNFTLPWVEKAIEETVLHGGKTLKYLETTLTNWQTRCTPDQRPWEMPKAIRQGKEQGKQFAKSDCPICGGTGEYTVIPKHHYSADDETEYEPITTKCDCWAGVM